MGVVSFWAILAAAVASMIIGFVWYGPLFGKQWMAMMNFSQADIEAAKQKGMAKSYILMIIGLLVTAYVLGHTMYFAMHATGATGAGAGISAGFWNWLGFIAPVMLGMVIWEGKSWKLWSLQSGYYLVSLIVQGIILASFI